MQAKRQSMAEVGLNVATGFCFSLLIWELLVNPLWPGWLITSIFTVSSLLRGYIFRRLFNNISEKV
jgi:hypothetical protein